MTKPFSRKVHAGWGAMDFNAHMRNTAYLDLSVDVRLFYFESHGFTMRDFEQLRLGPVVMRDEVEYFREVRLLETFDITLTLAGLSDDAARFRLCNEFFKEDGTLIARVMSTGGWMNLDERRLTLPPPALATALKALTHNEQWVDLPALTR